MGQSLSTYLQRLRVEASCQRLLASRDTVSSIAQAVGYTDLKHFTAVFRRHMGMTPRAFRSRMTAGTAKTWEGQKKAADVPQARESEPPGAAGIHGFALHMALCLTPQQRQRRHNLLFPGYHMGQEYMVIVDVLGVKGHADHVLVPRKISSVPSRSTSVSMSSCKS